MSWATAKGFNFRNTSGYVTDGASQQFVSDEAYPQTTTIGGDSVTWGWESVIEGNQRNRTTDSNHIPELAGLQQLKFADLESESVFRVDIPATGSYDIRAGFGDSDNASRAYFEFRDTSTAFGALADTAVTADQFIDASGTLRTTAALWHSANAVVTRAFSTTIFRIAIKATANGSSVINHVSVATAAATGSKLLSQLANQGGF